MKKVLFALICMAAICEILIAQDWGAPSHSTMIRTSSGFVAINAQNLNFTFSTPLIIKPGRGVPYIAALTYNSNIYHHPGENAPAIGNFFGWMPVSVVGNMSFQSQSRTCAYYNPYNHHSTNVPYQQYTNFEWRDPTGEVHLFALTTSTSNVCHSGISTGSAADDELGYVLDLTNYTSWVVHAPNGWTYSSNGEVEDTNGNYVTESSDTTGIAPMTTTSGTNCVNPVDGLTYPSCGTYDVIEPGSTTRMSFTVYYTSVTASTGCSGGYSGSAMLPVYLTLPEYTPGSNWYYRFGYGSTGQLNFVRLPAGGTISFSYGSLCTYNDGGPDSLSVTENDNHANTGTTTLTRSQAQTTIARPDGSKQVITFNGTYAGSLPTDIQYYGTNGTTLRKEVTNTLDPTSKWVASSVLYMDGAKTDEEDTAYDSTDISLPTSDTLIDWARDATGGTRRTKTITYNRCGTPYDQPPCTFPAAHILDRVGEVVVTDGQGVIASETVMAYDMGSTYSSGVTQNHDPAYSASNTTRGNVWDLELMAGPNTTLGPTYSYDDTGNSVTINSRTGQFSVNYGNCSGAYVSSRTAPGGNQSTTYDCSRGVPVSATDQNNATTNFAYGPDGRLAAQTDPDGGGVTYSFPDPNDSETVTKIDGSQNRVEWVTTDGFGRTVAVQTQRPDGQYDTVQTVYDVMGRIVKVSRPFASGRPASSATSSTEFTYDGLGRLLSTTGTDGSKTTYQYSQDAVKATDPAGRSRILQTDGAGRLWKVCEVSSQAGSGPCGTAIAANGFLTTYSYDPMGRLVLVQQGTQSRSYSWDWVGRMLTSNDPESGLTQYTYDSVTDATCPGGSSAASGRLVLVQDAAGMKTCLKYDSWGRLASRSYSTGGTDTFVWDGSSSTHSLGRIASASNAATTITYAYDPMGRPVTVTEAPAGLGAQTISYQYNDLGSAVSESAGGRGLDFSYDSKDRLTEVKDAGSGQIYLNGRSFNEADQVLGQTFSPGASFAMAASYGYNNRLQPWQLQYSALGTNLTVQYQWGAAIDANGNVTSGDDNDTLRRITYPVGPAYPGNPNWTLSYSYDDMNRLSSAASTDGVVNVTESIDAYGNRNQQSGTLSASFGSSPATNRVTGFTYDAAGRLLGGTWGSVMVARSFTWDPAGHILTYSEGGTTVDTYKYDPFGRRIETTGPGNNPTYYLYGTSDGGHPVAEYSGGIWYRHLIADGQHFGTVDSAGHIVSTAVDRLGTTLGKVDSRSSTFTLARYGPYGEEINSAGSEFTWTNQIRDANGMDHFAGRSYAANLARWLSPDPASPGSSNPNDPQSWNRYAYVGNNPASVADPSGLRYNPYLGNTTNYNSAAYMANMLENMDCMLDGMSAMCWIVEGVIHSGAGIDVTGMDTSPGRGLLHTENGYVWAWMFFRAWSDGTSGWQFGALLGYSSGEMQYIQEEFQKAAAHGPIDPNALNKSERDAFSQLKNVLKSVDPTITNSDIVVYEANGHDVEAKLSARALAALQAMGSAEDMVSHGILDTSLHPGYNRGAREAGSEKDESLHVVWISSLVAEALNESTSLASFHFDKGYPFASPKSFLEHTGCVLKVASCGTAQPSGH